MTADQAKAIALDTTQKEYDKVKVLIANTAKMGSLNISISTTSQALILRLRDEGYNVYINNNKPFYIVSWE